MSKILKIYFPVNSSKNTLLRIVEFLAKSFLITQNYFKINYDDKLLIKNRLKNYNYFLLRVAYNKFNKKNKIRTNRTPKIENKTPMN